MIYVYAIQSLKDGRIYVGMSKDVNMRILQHNKGLTFSTKGFQSSEIDIYRIFSG